MAKKKYDSVPFEWLESDPKRIWQAQISGEKNFEIYSFMGALNDLQGVPDWRSAFDGAVGLESFLDRLEKHFALCQLPVDGEGRFHVYMDAGRTKDHQATQEELLTLMRRHLNASAAALVFYKDKDGAERLRSIPIKWSEGEDYAAQDWDTQHEWMDGRPFGICLWEAWGELQLETHKPDLPYLIWCLGEAVYSLANDYILKRYLMQDFHIHNYDVDAAYDLVWKYGCEFYFDQDTCYVTPKPKD